MNVSQWLIEHHRFTKGRNNFMKQKQAELNTKGRILKVEKANPTIKAPGKPQQFLMLAVNIHVMVP